MRCLVLVIFITLSGCEHKSRIEHDPMDKCHQEPIFHTPETNIPWPTQEVCE